MNGFLTKLMRNRIRIKEEDSSANEKLIPPERSVDITSDKRTDGFRPVTEVLAVEGKKDFIDYIEWLGLHNNPDYIVLSSIHHYYYDEEELKKVNTVVNLIKLNELKEIKTFLHSIYSSLPPKSNLVGCFSDSKKQNNYALNKTASEYESRKISTALENGILSRVPMINRIYSIIDSRINKSLTRNNVTMLLQDHGFKVQDMTEINGLTYFYARKVKVIDDKCA